MIIATTMASSTNFFLLLPAFLSLIFSIGVAQNSIIFTEFTKLNFPPNVAAVGSLTLDFLGGGPYAGTVDGRILLYSGLTSSWQDYGYTSPRRTKALCDGNMDFNKFPICGYTAGLSFMPFPPYLYACDAYVGLTVVGILGGSATTLVRNTDAVPPFRFPNSVDAATDGMVYFVDTSAVYDAQNSNISLATGDSTGRLLRYNPRTGQLTTLLSQLARPVGVATNDDASYVLVSESNKRRIQRYWLRGEKPGNSEVFLTFEGGPSKIKRNREGNYWVAVNVIKNGKVAPQGVKFSPSGEILATVDLSKEYQQRVNTVMQHGDDEIFVAGNNITYVGRYKIAYT